MEITFVPGEPSVAELVRAVKLLVADFDGRQTSRVTGTGGQEFEFYPTAITDNIPPLHPELSLAVCLLSRYHLKEVAAATVGVGEEDRGAMIISDLLLFHGLPRTLARWTPTGAPGEIKVGEKEENHGRRHLLEETGLSLKTMLVTTLTPAEVGFRSKVI